MHSQSDYRLQPKLCFAIRATNMNMNPFFFARKEKETVTPIF